MQAIEQLESPIARREDLLIHDVDVTDALAVRVRVGLQAERGQRLVDRLALEHA